MKPRSDDPSDPSDRFDPAVATALDDARTADLLRAALRREADAVRPSPDGLARILAAARSTGGTADRTQVQHRGPSTVELPAVVRPPASAHPAPPAGARSGARSDAGDGGGRGVGARLRRLVPHPRPAANGTGARLSGHATRWSPALATAAAVALVAGCLGAVRLGVVHAPSLAAVVGAARQPAPAPTTVVAPPPLPVYLVSRQEGRWALVREFAATTLTDPGQRLEAALNLAVTGTASDPDLTSIWASEQLRGQVRGELTTGGVTVRLSDGLVAARPTSPERPGLARLAVQQLVWTATAVAGAGHDGPVRLEGPTRTTSLFDELRLGTTFTRTLGDADPRAPVWVSSLTDGQRLRQGPAVVSGDATTTDSGAVQWALTGPDGDTVATGSQRLVRQDGSVPRVGERALFTLRVTLPAPGVYRLAVTQGWPWATPDLTWTDTKTLQAAA